VATTPTSAPPIRPTPTFNGFYLRNSLACTGLVPSPGPYCLSPDVIVASEPVADPSQAFSTPQSWQTSYSVEPDSEADNYYYVRGMNGAAKPVEGSLRLFWMPAQLIPFPTTWQQHELGTTDKASSLAVAAASEAIGVGDGAFLWESPPALGDGRYYALAAVAEGTKAPGPLPAVGSWLDMGELITQRLNFGFRNSSQVQAEAPSWYRRVHIEVPPGITAGEVTLSVTSEGFVGNTVGLIADLFGANREPMMLLPSKIAQDGASSSINVTLEGGQSLGLALQYWNTGAQPSPGATIVLSADYVVPESELDQAGARALVNPGRSRFLAETGDIGPTAFVPLGSATFIAE
jgi:hypothetical protein